jgi:ribonuclease HI
MSLTPPRNRSRLYLFVDGAARGNPGPAGVGAALFEKKESAKPLVEIALYIGETTNNVAEYCALLVGLQEAAQRSAAAVEVFTDSELLARQVTGQYKVRDERLQWLHALVRHAAAGFSSFSITHIPREKNKKADRLANQAVTAALRSRPVKPQPKRAAVPADGGFDQRTLF